VHDPDVVAHVIVRPWPQRSAFPATGSRGDSRRWSIRLHHDHVPGCAAGGCTKRQPFPWWRPRSYSRFWRLAGRDLYWPPLVTIWHREPGGRDALTECQRRVQRADGTWRYAGHWRWHVRHFRYQLHPYQNARRALLTRCAWCGSRRVKRDPVNISHSWDGQKARWWQGERGLFHRDCSVVWSASRMCLCAAPVMDGYGGYGTCAACGKFRAWNSQPDDADRLLAGLAPGSRITPELRPLIDALWAERRARKEAQEGIGA
jgi:hypothetical protein